MPTLVLPPRMTDDCEAMQHAAVAAGWEIYAAEGWSLPGYLSRQDPVVYADPLFADVAAAELGLRLFDPPLDWTARLPEHLRKREVQFANLGTARALKSGSWFVKPADDKSFPARVYEFASESPGEALLPAEMPVLIAEPVRWLLEVRCFVLDRVVRTLSPYLRDGELVQEPDGSWPITAAERLEALGFVASVIEEAAVSLPPAVVVDVGIIEGRGWAVIEANAAWGSGIYGCDPVAILPVVRRASVTAAAVTDTDSLWLRPAVVIER